MKTNRKNATSPPERPRAASFAANAITPKKAADRAIRNSARRGDTGASCRKEGPARKMPLQRARINETVSQVFLSYRHVEPDERLAEGLCAFLQQRGLRVFLDKQIRISLDWAMEIDRQLRASDSFVVFLSEDSIRSDMLRQEVQIAHELRQEGKLAIFPIRLGFQGKLPYDLGSYLNRIQYALWHPGDAETELFGLLHTAITGGASLPMAQSSDNLGVVSLADSSVAAEWKGAPLPAADPRIVIETGTIRLDSPFYVRRREDAAAESFLAQPGSTIVVKGPRQSGKSSLLARLYTLSKQWGRRSVYLDFQTFDEPQLASLGTILQTSARRIARTLKTPLQPDDVWDSDLLGEKGSFAEFLGRAVLDGSSSPVVLILDEVDRLFDRAYRGDFFAAVRGWHNNRAMEESWDNLHLVLGHATDPALWIENLNESPFNVGDRLRLGEFTRDEVADLNERYGNPLRSFEEI